MGEWVSVEDELPMTPSYGLSGMEEVDVLATDGLTVAKTTYQRGSGGGMPWTYFNVYCDELSADSITHWQPLPEPPK